MKQVITRLEHLLQQEQAQLKAAMTQSKHNPGSEAAVSAAEGAIATTEGQLTAAISKLAALLQGQSSSTSGSMVNTSA
jgi:hypothetical protein